jgi:hypothetical protein
VLTTPLALLASLALPPELLVLPPSLALTHEQLELITPLALLASLTLPPFHYYITALRISTRHLSLFDLIYRTCEKRERDAQNYL